MEHLVRSGDRSSDFVLFGELAMHAPVMREAIRRQSEVIGGYQKQSDRLQFGARANLAQISLKQISFISRSYLVHISHPAHSALAHVY